MTTELVPQFQPRELDGMVRRLGEIISSDFPDGVLLVGVLTGSFCFLADLARKITVPCLIDFLSLSSYQPGERRVRIAKDLDQDVAGKDVVIIEDIVDTGLSARYVMSLLEQRRARSVAICALLDRPDRRIVPVPLTYVGVQVSESFLVGYGLDIAERYRNLAGLYVVELEDFDAEDFESKVYAPSAEHTLKPTE